MVIRIGLLFSIVFYLVGCETARDLIPTVIKSTSKNVNDSAPTTSKDISTIADAQPKPVRRTRAGNKSPYTVFGETYTVLKESKGYQERGGASWYGTKFHGRKTSNGEVYDMWAMTAAHKTLPIPSYVRVTNVENGRSIVVRVNDRGPFHSQRIIDLSYAAALKLGFAEKGVAQVDVIDITPVVDVPVTVNTPKASVAAQPTPVNSPKITFQAKTSNPPISASSVYLQAAAFKSKESADKLQTKLSATLSEPVNVVPNATGTWFRVRVGPIVGDRKLSEARQLLSEQGIYHPQLIRGH